VIAAEGFPLADVLAVGADVLAVGADVLAVGADVLAVGADVLAVGADVPAVSGVPAVFAAGDPPPPPHPASTSTSAAAPMATTKAGRGAFRPFTVRFARMASSFGFRRGVMPKRGGNH
jgi:hypothetical protein